MSLNVTGVLDAVVSHAMSTGLFEQVNQHEPKNAPGNGLTCAIWADRIGGIRSSGLDSVSVRLAFSVRIFTPMQAEPADDIDENLLAALDTLMAAYARNFTLGGLVRHVDLLGAEGVPLEALAGYITVDGGEYRVFTITLPLLVNDLWTEAP